MGTEQRWHRCLVFSTLLAVCLVSACCSGRAAGAESDQIARLLALEPGLRVADVGAGDGDFSAALSHWVGPAGQIFATEVEEDKVEDIRRLVDRKGLANVTPILGDAKTTGLPEACCDAILLRLVYHHFTDPAAMRASLRRSLRPGGRVLIIDIVPQSGWRELPGVPDRGGHGIPPESLLQEMTSDGFEMIERIDTWDGDRDKFSMVFRATG